MLRAAFLKRVAALCCLGLSVACAQNDVPTLTLNSPAVWLEPHQNGLAILYENNTVIYTSGVPVTERGGIATSLKSLSVQSDSIISCANELYGVMSYGLGHGDLFAEVELVDLVHKDWRPSGPTMMRHSRPACVDGELFVLSTDNELLRLSSDLEVLARVSLNALPDAEIMQADLTGDGEPEIILLSDPTERYAHAVLGDALEAASINVFSLDLELLTSYTLAEPYVFEQRRVLPFEFLNEDDVAENELRQGILATVSSADMGAGVVLFVMEEGELKLSAQAPPIGTGFRWLNLFAAADGAAYAVKTPHIGGPLERYRFSDGRFSVEPFDLGVSNHVYGERNLDLGVLLESENGVHTLAVALDSRRGVSIIECTESCETVTTFETQANLSSNVARVLIDGQIHVAFADSSGAVYVEKIYVEKLASP